LLAVPLLVTLLALGVEWLSRSLDSMKRSMFRCSRWRDACSAGRLASMRRAGQGKAENTVAACGRQWTGR